MFLVAAVVCASMSTEVVVDRFGVVRSLDAVAGARGETGEQARDRMRRKLREQARLEMLRVNKWLAMLDDWPTYAHSSARARATVVRSRLTHPPRAARRAPPAPQRSVAKARAADPPGAQRGA